MRKTLIVLIVGAFGMSLAAQNAAQRQGPNQQQIPSPTFRTSVNAVLLDVRVVDRDGQFVRNLTKDDFSIEEDGEPQTISTFELVDIPTEPPERPQFEGKWVDADVASNEHSEGRIYMVVLDDLRMHPLRSAVVRALAREFVEKHVTSADRVALSTTSSRKDMTLEFTSDKRRLLEAIDKLQGNFGPPPYPGASHLTDPALVQLRALAHWMSTIDGRRKTIVLISEGLNSGLPDLPEETGADEPAFYDGSGRPSVFDTFAQRSGGALDLRDVIDAAAQANVSFYAIDPMGHPGAPAPGVKPTPYLLGGIDGDISADVPYRTTSKQIALQILAEETGGGALIRSNDFSQAFDRIVQDSSSYYLLGYSSTRRDGKFHHIDVRANVPDVRVRTRSGYVAATDKAPKKMPTGWTPELFSAIQSPVQLSGVTMNVGASVRRGAGGKGDVEMIVESRAPGLTTGDADLRRLGSIVDAIVVADASGDVKASHQGSLQMDLKDTREAVETYGVRLLTHFELKAGHYEVRVGGVDEVSGSKGSVHYSLDVPDFGKGPLTMSTVTVASSEESRRPTTGADKDWRRHFVDPPTATRAFAVKDELRIGGEVYTRKNDPIEVLSSIRTSSGAILYRHEDRFDGGSSKNGNSVSYQLSIPLITIGPCECLLTVTARDTAVMSSAAERQVPFTVR
jgi:VWFA-related protein